MKKNPKEIEKINDKVGFNLKDMVNKITDAVDLEMSYGSVLSLMKTKQVDKKRASKAVRMSLNNTEIKSFFSKTNDFNKAEQGTKSNRNIVSMETKGGKGKKALIMKKTSLNKKKE